MTNKILASCCSIMLMIVSAVVITDSMAYTPVYGIGPEPIFVELPPRSYKLDPELECLAMNIYFEARGERPMGQYAVGFVTINRLKTSHYPDSICDVVKQKVVRKNRKICQFSWVCSGYTKEHVRNPTAWERAKQIAKDILSGAKSNVGKSTHFLNPDTATANWHESDRFRKVSEIGNHVFFEDRMIAATID